MSSISEEDIPFSPRRGTRIKKLSSKAQESVSSKKSNKTKDSSEDESSTTEEENDTKMDVDKPITLFEGDDVEGKKMYSFQTPKKRDSMLQKVTESLTPRTKIHPNTSQGPLKKSETVKTPYRNQLKKELAVRFKAAVDSEEEEPEDFEDSGSDFQPSDKSSAEALSEGSDVAANAERSESDSGDDLSDGDDDDNSKTTFATSKQTKCTKNQSPTKQTRSRPTRRKQDLNYFLKTDDYFTQSATKRIVTSNHTLDKLETPRLPQEQLQHLLAHLKLSDAHQEALNSLSAANGSGGSSSHFDKWLLLLREGFSVLLYGLGSKRTIVQRFVAETVGDRATLIVNGYFPSVGVKDVLDGVMDYLEVGAERRPTNAFEACNVIEETFDSDAKLALYLIVHNIDGAMLRSGRSQKVLAKLARIRNVRLLATIDHIHTPLLWDHSKISKFNFSWWDVTSFLPYTNETSYEGSMMVKRSGNLALSSLNNVFLSLTSNSKGIYLNVVKKQLENRNVPHYQGLLFKDLYWACREAFLVSSDLALRAQLTEFVDHKMVKIKRSVDGGEYLCIPIDNNLLQKFLDDQTKS